MDDDRLPSPGDDPAPIADAEALFQDAPRPATAPTTPSEGASTDDAYEVEGVPLGAASDDVSPVRPPVPVSPAPKPGPARRGGSSRPASPEEAVTQVWTRTSEWGTTLVVLAGAAFVLGLVVYGLLSAEEFSLAFLALVVGGAAWVLLTYPILITLERPVRVTPEQAVRDFYGALSHHVPHYRRMWLLLSDAGKFQGSFATFEGFRNYWKSRVAQLRGGRSSALTPLKFVVGEFKSEKSVGRTDVEAAFSVKVFVRGRLEAGPVETFRVETTLVKGPDRMWYLDRGTLP